MSRLHRARKKLRRPVRTGLTIATVALLYACVVYFAANLTVRPAQSQRLVTIYDRGQTRVVLTQATTVRDALEEADVRLDPRDKTEPEREVTLSGKSADVIIYRSRLVAVHDGALRQNVLTVEQSPNAILSDAQLAELKQADSASFERGRLQADGTSVVLKVKRAAPEPEKVIEPAPKAPDYVPLPNALTPSKGAQIFVDSLGVAHRETYYDLPMNIVIRACGGGAYSVRSDGAKVDQDGFVLVAANLRSYPRCSVVETSLGPGKVYDTGGFAIRHPYGFDLATDWTNYNGL